MGEKGLGGDLGFGRRIEICGRKGKWSHQVITSSPKHRFYAPSQPQSISFLEHQPAERAVWLQGVRGVGKNPEIEKVSRIGKKSKRTA